MKSSIYNGHHVFLIESVADFIQIKENLSEKVSVGVDTETTGLDFYNDHIVGVCISCGKTYKKEDYSGYYIPIRHSGYSKNVDIPSTIELVQFIVDNYKTCWWNRNFDFTMLEKDGFKAPFVGKTHDGQCMAHLVKGDSFPKLKDFASIYLKYSVIEFSENNAEKNNFGSTDPLVTYIYAAQDPIITTLVTKKLWTEYPYIRKIYPIDNKFAEALRKFCYTANLYLDTDLLEKMYEKTLEDLNAIKNQIFSFTGYTFKLNSNRDKADALSRYVTLTEKTGSGAFSVKDEVLEKIEHPLAAMFRKYAELEKFRGTYLAKMKTFTQPFHINYQHCNVSTGRISSGSARGNSFFADFNIQNVPKVEVFRYIHKANIEDSFTKENPYQFDETGVDEKEVFEITTEVGTFKVDADACVKVLRGGVEEYVLVRDLEMGDEILSV